jgi:hypothetical protein
VKEIEHKQTSREIVCYDDDDDDDNYNNNNNNNNNTIGKTGLFPS